MGFLQHLKTQASAVRGVQVEQQASQDANTLATERVCQTVLYYLEEMAQQLNIIEPDAPRLSLDAKTHWPDMKLSGFLVDSRKKMLRDREVFDYISVGWQIVPRTGSPVTGSVSANFPPDLQRLENRIAAGWVEHERHEVRHPEKNALLFVRFDYTTQSRGNIRVTADHQNATLAFRLANLTGFGIATVDWPVAQLHQTVLDELAKMVCGEPSRFA